MMMTPSTNDRPMDTPRLPALTGLRVRLAWVFRRAADRLDPQSGLTVDQVNALRKSVLQLA